MKIATAGRRAVAGLLFGIVLLGSFPADAEARRKRKRDREAPEGVSPEDVPENAGEAYKHLYYGNQFYQQGSLRRAEESFNRALDIHPRLAEAHYMLAVLYLELGNLDVAIAAAERALEVNPFLTEAHNVLGLIHARKGNETSALKEFEVVLNDLNYPTPEVAHFNIGRIFWERGDAGEAMPHFRRALEVNTKFGRAWYLLGDCQEQLGQRAEAKQSYTQAIEAMDGQGGETRPMYRLGFLCFQDGEHAVARQWFDKVRILSPASEEAQAARVFIQQMEFR